jgi:predicted dehydrogenase
VWLSIIISYLDHHPKENWFEITGTEGTLLLTADRWKTVRKEGDQTTTSEGPNVDAQWHRYYQNLADHLVKGKPLIITPQWSRRMIHILDLATRSAEQGVTLRAKYS